MPFCRGRRQSIIMRIMSMSIIMTIAAAAVTMMTTMTATVGVAVDVDTTMRMGDENVFGRKFFLRFGIGLAVFLAAVFLHEGTIRTILYICAYLIFGYDVLLRAAKHIGQGKFSMKLPDVFLYDWRALPWEMAEAVFVMLFYQVGEAFQEYAVARSRKSITALLDIRPDLHI